MTIEVIEFIQSLRTDFLDYFFSFISFLGEDYVYVFVLSIIYFTYDKKMGEFLGLALFTTALLNNALKGIVLAQRPFEKFPDRVINLRPETATGASFPSGHTQNFATFVTSFSIWTKKKIIWILAMTFSILMAISRMYLGVHFLEDVVTSLILGIAMAFVIHNIYKRVRKHNRGFLFVYSIILVVFLPFLFLQDTTYGEDFFKSYGLMLGFTLAMFIENRYIKFSVRVAWWKKIVRVVLGFIVMVGLMTGLSIVFDFFAEEATLFMNILDMFRYGLIAFVGLGIYPFLFKKFNF